MFVRVITKKKNTHFKLYSSFFCERMQQLSPSLRCYQCGDVGDLCEKATGRFFCTDSHQKSYHQGWRVLNALLRAKPLAHGMKRGLPADGALLSLTEFENLPDDVVLEILRHALDNVSNSLEQLKAALDIRMTSVRLRDLIDFEILGKVSELSAEVSSVMNDEMIALFTGLRRIDTLYIEAYNITESFYASFTRLEFLRVRQYDITDDALRQLTTLRTLEFQEVDTLSEFISNRGIETLTNLTTLRLDRDTFIDDDGLLPLAPFLEDLTLIGTSIEGECFRSMTRLVSLRLDMACSIYEYNLSYVAPTLEFLSVSGYNSLFTLRSFDTMTRLVELSVAGDFYAWRYLPALAGTLTKLSLHNVTLGRDDDPRTILSLTRLNDLMLNGRKTPVTNTILAQMTSLTKLDIGVSDSINNQALIPLSQMRDLEVNHAITGEALVNMQKSLEVIRLKMFGKIRWTDLAKCESLKIVHVIDFASLHAPKSQEVLEKETGIKFVTTV